MRCDETRARFDDLRLDGAPVETLAPFRDHLDRCASCRDDFLCNLVLVHDLEALRSLEAPPGDVAERVMRAVARERSFRTGPLAAAASFAFLAVVVPLGAAVAPGWTVATVRGTVRLVSEAATALPTAFATAGALFGGFRSVLRAVLLDLPWIESARPFLLAAGHSLVGAVLAASLLLAGREWRVARKRAGARS